MHAALPGADAVIISVASPPRVTIRPAEARDMGYVLEVWRRSWRGAPRIRKMRGGVYRAYFGQVVERGVLAQVDTAIAVLCDTIDQDVILGWACYTPDRRVPVVHYGVVRNDVRERGLFATLLGAIGVKDRVVYTFHAPTRAHRYAKPFDMEGTLLQAAKRRGIVAAYQDVEAFLAGR